MIAQMTVLVLMVFILHTGTSLRHFAVEGCQNCNCGSEKCCEDQKKHK